MEILNENDEIRSEDVRDFIERIPTWIIRWGILIITLVVFFSLALSWFIKYPDIVTVSFSLSSEDLPIPIIPKVDGRIDRLFYEEGVYLSEGTILAFIESTADHLEVLKLEEMLNSFDKKSFFQPIKTDSFGNLGELQKDFQSFQKINSLVHSSLHEGFYLKQIGSLEDDIRSFENIISISEEQLILYERDAYLSKMEFQVNQKLYANSAISELDLFREESKKLTKEIPIATLKNIIQNSMTSINLKRREVLEIENSIIQLKEDFKQSISNLKSDILLWKSRFLLISPVSGLVFSSTIIQEGQMVNSGNEIFYIVSNEEYSKGQIQIPQENFGKVKIGQKVLIKFDAFPFQEFGLVQGSISSIYPLPGGDNSFFAEVDLPSKLVTNTGRKLNFRLGMSATAEIVTEDLSLFERLFNSVRRNFLHTD